MDTQIRRRKLACFDELKCCLVLCRLFVRKMIVKILEEEGLELYRIEVWIQVIICVY